VKILIIDDERIIRNTFKIFLENTGYEVLTSENVEQAYELMDHHEFALVITDCIMPKTNGLELLKSMRNKGNSTPIIVMTGEPTSESQALAFEVKASAYLAKPIGKSILLETVKKIFNSL